MHAKSSFKGGVGFFWFLFITRTLPQAIVVASSLNRWAVRLSETVVAVGPSPEDFCGDALLESMVWDCCTSVASSHEKPWRGLVAVSEEMVVLCVLKLEEAMPGIWRGQRSVRVLENSEALLY